MRPVSQYDGSEGRAGQPAPRLMQRRRVIADRISDVGLDVHKESIVVAVASLAGWERCGRYGQGPFQLPLLDRSREGAEFGDGEFLGAGGGEHAGAGEEVFDREA
jgi:hypothetical protein